MKTNKTIVITLLAIIFCLFVGLVLMYEAKIDTLEDELKSCKNGTEINK